MYYYKVVSKDLESCCITGKYQLQYAVGEWTKPKIGRIMVFNNLVDARGFYNKYTDLIYTCEVKNPRKRKWCALYAFDIEKYWHRKKCYNALAPVGTYGVDAVMLDQIVSIDYEVT